MASTREVEKGSNVDRREVEKDGGVNRQVELTAGSVSASVGRWHRREGGGTVIQTDAATLGRQPGSVRAAGRELGATARSCLGRPRLLD